MCDSTVQPAFDSWQAHTQQMLRAGLLAVGSRAGLPLALRSQGKSNGSDRFILKLPSVTGRTIAAKSQLARMFVALNGCSQGPLATRSHPPPHPLPPPSLSPNHLTSHTLTAPASHPGMPPGTPQSCPCPAPRLPCRTCACILCAGTAGMSTPHSPCHICACIKSAGSAGGTSTPKGDGAGVACHTRARASTMRAGGVSGRRRARQGQGNREGHGGREGCAAALRGAQGSGPPTHMGAVPPWTASGLAVNVATPSRRPSTSFCATSALPSVWLGVKQKWSAAGGGRGGARRVCVCIKNTPVCSGNEEGREDHAGRGSTPHMGSIMQRVHTQSMLIWAHLHAGIPAQHPPLRPRRTCRRLQGVEVPALLGQQVVQLQGVGDGEEARE